MTSVLQQVPVQASPAITRAPGAQSLKTQAQSPISGPITAQLTALQRLAGNLAVSTLVSPLLADPKLAAAVNNAPPLRQGDANEGVARMQNAMAALGHEMPKTVKQAGETDGKYGPETRQTVADFQTEQGVRPVGGHEAGRKTLTALDVALTAAGPVPTDASGKGGSGGVTPTRRSGSGPTRLPSPPQPFTPPASSARKAPASAAAFTSGVFTEPVFRPTSGGGEQFFIRYTPATSELFIGVKAAVDFRHSASIVRQAGEAQAVPEPGVGKKVELFVKQINQKPEAARAAEVDKWRWQGGAEEQTWLINLRGAVENAWSASTTGIQFVLAKPGFPAAIAKVSVIVEVDDRAGKQILNGPTVPVPDRHLDITTWKRPSSIPELDEGVSSLDRVHASMTLSSSSVSGRVQDNPLAFEWDPAGQSPFISSVEAWAADMKSARTALGSAAAVAGKVPDPAGQPISLIVRGNDPAVRTKDAADLVAAIGTGSGDPSRLKRLPDQPGKRGATMFVGDGIAQTVAVHEFGHLFGLGDEYAQSFRAAGTEASHSGKAGAMGPTGPRGALVETNDSIMSAGSKVRPQHYAIFLDALRKVTGLTEWQLK